MTSTLEQNRKIITDVPEGASHVLLQEDGEPVFFTTCKESGEFLFNTGFDWDCFGAFEQLDCLTQSLDDIRENIALQERVEELIGFLNHLVEHECISDCSLHIEATTLLAKGEEE